MDRVDKVSQDWQNSEKEREEWIRGWADNMIKFWQERMMAFSPPVYDTGTLYSDMKRSLTMGMNSLIEHRFREYGIYVAAGTGNGYKHGNSGADDEKGLQFMRGKKWNKGVGHRKARDWFSKKYLYSIHRLNDHEAQYFGEAYQGLLADALSAMFGDTKALIKSNNDRSSFVNAVGNL